MIRLLLTVLMLFGTPAWCADMGVIDITDWSGGLNTRDGLGGVADNELTKSINCYLLANGIAKRNGYESYNDSARVDTSKEGTGIVYAPFTAGSKIVATAGTKVKYKGTSAWTDITGSVTLTADTPVMFTMVNNNLVGCNGANPAWYWDGTGTATTLSGTNIPTAPTAAESFHGRLFLAQGRGLYWSEYLGNWKTFHPDDWQTFEEDITGIKVYGSTNDAMLVVFTERSIHTCQFDATISISTGGRGLFRFNTISTKHGCSSPYSIQECVTEDGQIVLIWADNDGLKALFGDTVIKLTDKIQPDWDNLVFTELDEAVGIHYKPKRWYMLLCTNGSGTDHNRVIVYDLRNWTVSGYFDWAISNAGVVRISGEDKLIGSNYAGYWNTYDSGGSDAGGAINAYFETKSYDNEQPWYDKGFQSIGLHHAYKGAYNLDITMKYEYGDNTYGATYTPSETGVPLGSFVLGVDALSGVGDLVIRSTPISGRGRNAQIRIGNDDANEPFEIYQIGLLYELGRVVIGR